MKRSRRQSGSSVDRPDMTALTRLLPQTCMVQVWLRVSTLGPRPSGVTILNLLIDLQLQADIIFTAGNFALSGMPLTELETASLSVMEILVNLDLTEHKIKKIYCENGNRLGEKCEAILASNPDSEVLQVLEVLQGENRSNVTLPQGMEQELKQI
ncbi:hypothetical protein E2C01_030184 [Portunus trituberculatus]|uniref:Uncharacterized protein n=1 Tax=Portunus trituberculatus TaxID=210409 RepID=A0A5B7EU82_PORTR|nr:hypothetical protein [Portunus trituberculatus]